MQQKASQIPVLSGGLSAGKMLKALARITKSLPNVGISRNW